MQLKKLRVKVKQTAKPRKTTERITTTRRSNTMPDIQLPKMGGMGGGLDEGIGGFQMVADLSQMTLMGSGRSVGNDFEGTYYYFMQNRSGAEIPEMNPFRGAATPPSGLFFRVLKEFLEKGWDTSVFDPYWRAPKKLYATQFFIPPVQSTLAPEKFGDTSRNQAALWVAHYKGEIGHKTGGRFRFWGFSDDVLFVRVNGKTILDACWPGVYDSDLADWRSSADENRRFQLGQGLARVSDWFDLEPGVPLEMEVLLGAAPGGGFQAMLCVQEDGVEYPERDDGGLVLPVFKTVETPQHLVYEMGYTLPEGLVDFEGGPIFSAY